MAGQEATLRALVAAHGMIFPAPTTTPPYPVDLFRWSAVHPPLAKAKTNGAGKAPRTKGARRAQRVRAGDAVEGSTLELYVAYQPTAGLYGFYSDLVRAFVGLSGPDRKLLFEVTLERDPVTRELKAQLCTDLDGRPRRRTLRFSGGEARLTTPHRRQARVLPYQLVPLPEHPCTLEHSSVFSEEDRAACAAHGHEPCRTAPLAPSGYC